MDVDVCIGERLKVIMCVVLNECRLKTIFKKECRHSLKCKQVRIINMYIQFYCVKSIAHASDQMDAEQIIKQNIQNIKKNLNTNIR